MEDLKPAAPLPPPPVERVIVVTSTKSPGLAAALGFFFGPVGLIYSTVLGAFVMFGVNLVVGFVTLGFGLFFSWPVCAIWGYVAATRSNARTLAAAGVRAL